MMFSKGSGDDWLRGDYGADKLDGGEGVDWAEYGHSSEGVNVNLRKELEAGVLQKETLKNIENVYGSSSDDVIIEIVPTMNYSEMEEMIFSKERRR